MNGPFTRNPSLADEWIAAAESALRTLAGGNRASRPMPKTAHAPLLTSDQRKLAGSLMRVNHVGEVCAQALYSAQSLTARSPALKASFTRAAQEETDHLAWTQQRLIELNTRPSLFNPVWFTGAFCIGCIAGLASDGASLGFVAETEHQVEQHLASHLGRLPVEDLTSRAIVSQMKEDEARHGAEARQAGALDLPGPIKGAMRLAAKLMTTIAHHL